MRHVTSTDLEPHFINISSASPDSICQGYVVNMSFFSLIVDSDIRHFSNVSLQIALFGIYLQTSIRYKQVNSASVGFTNYMPVHW